MRGMRNLNSPLIQPERANHSIKSYFKVCAYVNDLKLEMNYPNLNLNFFYIRISNKAWQSHMKRIAAVEHYSILR